MAAEAGSPSCPNPPRLEKLGNGRLSWGRDDLVDYPSAQIAKKRRAPKKCEQTLFLTFCCRASRLVCF